MTVFVNNLPEVTRVNQLRNAFSSMGKVFDAFIANSSRRGRGVYFGFVRFADMGTAVKAVEKMNGMIFVGRKMEVMVARFGGRHRCTP